MQNETEVVDVEVSSTSELAAENEANLEFAEFFEQINETSVYGGITSSEAFFNEYSVTATERGDLPIDIDYCFFRGQNLKGQKIRIDGWGSQETQGTKGFTHSEFYIVGCFFDQELDVPNTANASEIEAMFREVENAIRFISSPEFLNDSGANEDAANLGLKLAEAKGETAFIKIVVLTNRRLTTRKSEFPEKEFMDTKSRYSIIGWDQYLKFKSSGFDKIEIDFAQDFGKTIPCVLANDTDDITSFLFAFDGNTLADLAERFGDRLLESNVRTYLENRTKTNKGMLATIKGQPEKFFAYNNGLTATASSVELIETGNGLQIAQIDDLQIVNGGQTTSSLLYARSQNGDSLEGISVPVKLNVIFDEGKRSRIIPNISRFANSQNKVSESDLISNEAFQVALKKMFDALRTPSLGRLAVPKWFYERANGQYKSIFRYQNDGRRKALKSEYPRELMLTKTDAAKYFLASDIRPWIVSQGAQKCFMAFTKDFKQRFKKEPEILNELWVQDLAATALLFRELDKSIGSSAWYQADRGYKAQIVAYTVSLWFECCRINNAYPDLQRLWNEQSTPSSLLYFLTEIGALVKDKLKSPPPGVSNISEYAKREFCWSLGVQPIAERLGTEMVEDHAIDLQTKHTAEQNARDQQALMMDTGWWMEGCKRWAEIPDLRKFLMRIEKYPKRTADALDRAARGTHAYKEGDGKRLWNAFSEYDES